LPITPASPELLQSPKKRRADFVYDFLVPSFVIAENIREARVENLQPAFIEKLNRRFARQVFIIETWPHEASILAIQAIINAPSYRLKCAIMDAAQQIYNIECLINWTHGYQQCYTQP